MSPAPTILVVEDEEAVRRLLVVLLETEGYRVLETGSGEAALEIVDREGDRVDLAVVDLGLPDVRGDELIERIRERRGAAFPALCVSGYPEGRTGEEPLTGANVAFLAKPFSPEDLRDGVRRLLGDDAPAKAPKRE